MGPLTPDKERLLEAVSDDERMAEALKHVGGNRADRRIAKSVIRYGRKKLAKEKRKGTP